MGFAPQLWTLYHLTNLIIFSEEYFISFYFNINLEIKENTKGQSNRIDLVNLACSEICKQGNFKIYSLNNIFLFIWLFWRKLDTCVDIDRQNLSIEIPVYMAYFFC